MSHYLVLLLNCMSHLKNVFNINPKFPAKNDKFNIFFFWW